MMTTSTHKLHTTGQTTRLQMVYNIVYSYRVLFAAIGFAFLLGTLVTTITLMRGGEASTPVLQPVLIISTPTPSMPSPTPVPVSPTPSTSPRLSAAVVAYDAPGGNVLGPIEADRTYTIVARYGADWLQADIDGSGLVWMKSDELGTVTVAAHLTDLRPTPTAEVVYVIQERPSGEAHTSPPSPALQPPDAQPTAPLSAVEGPIREKPTPVLTEAEQYWTWPTAVPLARTPGVEVSSAAYEACRRSGQSFSECKQHMPDDYFTLHDQYDH